MSKFGTDGSTDDSPVVSEFGADGSADSVDFSSEAGIKDVARDEIRRRVDNHQQNGYGLFNGKEQNGQTKVSTL